MRIIHTHPSADAAKIFVEPLLLMDRNIGCISDLCTDSDISRNSMSPGSLRLGQFFFIGNFIALSVLLKLFNRTKYDILISHNTLASLLPLVVGAVFKVPRRIYFNHGVPYRGYRGLKRFALKMVEKLNCFFATEIICVNRADASDSFAGIALRKKVSVIANGSACGVDLRLYAAPRPEKLAKSNSVVLFAGRATVRKGFDRLLEIAKILEESPRISFIACGVSAREARKYTVRLPSNISFLGWIQPEIWREILSASDLLLAPSLHEGFPYSILESWASGVPVLARRSPGHIDLLRHGETGILYDHDTPDLLAQNMIEILENKALLCRLSEAGYREVARYSRDNFKVSYERFIRQVKTSGK